jgi:hypothetical protein
MLSSHSPDALVVGFDDDHAVANAGLLLPATLAQRLGIEQVVDSWSTSAAGRAPIGRAARC